MNSPESGLVSVVIPTYNRGDLIAETIRSVLSQTYDAFELIIVDDGSTDNTGEVVKSFPDARIKYIKTNNSGLPAAPRNRGYAESSGEFVAFLDSDDLWLENKLEKQVAAMRKDPSVGLVYCKCEFFGSDYRGARIFPGRGYSGCVFDFITRGNFVPTVSVLCRRVALETAGTFDESKKLRAFEDYELWIRIAGAFKFFFIDEVLCRFRMHSQNILGTDNLKSHLGAFRALCSAINKMDFTSGQLKKSVAHHYLTTAMAWLEAGNTVNFSGYLRRSLELNPEPVGRFIHALNSVIGPGALGAVYNFYRRRRAS